MPAWFGPPRWTLGGVVPLTHVLARTESVAVCISGVTAYPEGFGFDVVALATETDEDFDPFFFGMHRRRGGGGGVPPELLRLGIEFADGQKATNLGGMPFGQDRPAGPVLHPGGGGGGGGDRWEQRMWAWPLPPAGALAFVCEWPARSIPVTRWEFDAGAIREAAARATVVFPDEHLPSWPPSDDDDDRPAAFGVIR